MDALPDLFSARTTTFNVEVTLLPQFDIASDASSATPFGALLSDISFPLLLPVNHIGGSITDNRAISLFGRYFDGL